MCPRFSSLALAIAIAWPASLVAQELNQVAIFGFVTDSQTGQPVSGVMVAAINEADTTQKSTAVSDASGRYQMNLVTSVAPTRGDVPSSFRLLQNYPNPFNPSTVIRFQISDPSDVRLVIYNMLGQRVRTLVHQRLLPGEYSFAWDATDDRGRGVAAGLYFYQLRTDEFAKTKKMVLLDSNASGSSNIGSGFSTLHKRGQEGTQSRTLMVTIRARSARIQHFEQSGVLVSAANFRFDIGVTVTQQNVLNRDLIVVSEPGVNGKIFISGLARAVIDTVIGTEKVSVRNERTREDVAMRANYDGGFPLMSLEAEVGDTLTITLFSEEQQVGESEEATVEANAPPRVIRSSITNGDKDIIVDAIIFIDFSESMDSLTVDQNSLMLADNAGTVSGTIGFLNDNTVATFDPDQSLVPLITYTFTVTTDVTDLQGNHLQSTFTVTFTTGSGVAEGRIAFHSHIDGQGIYVMNSDGSNLTKLTKFDDSHPSWSPDGTRIVFSRDEAQIYIINSDGTFPESLTNYGWLPDFSPDGTRITFTRDPNSNSEIFVMNINGTDPVNVTNHPSVDFGSSWSPDGSKIAYASWRDGQLDIFVMGRNGENVVNLTSSLEGSFDFPVWSPDGTEIAFIRVRGNTKDEELYVMNSDGSNSIVLTKATEWGGSRPTWSPDGSRIAFVVSKDVGDAIAVINRDGSNLIILTPFGINEAPDWSP